jgi:hypothetical protein
MAAGSRAADYGPVVSAAMSSISLVSSIRLANIAIVCSPGAAFPSASNGIAHSAERAASG